MSQGNPAEFITRQELGKNNIVDQDDPSSTIFGDSSRRSIPAFGFLVDDNSGPLESPLPVALRGDNASWTKDNPFTDTEVICTSGDRDSNYVHAGWSLSATSTLSPWASSRILQKNRANIQRSWITKRLIRKKRTVYIRSEDLRPTPEFEAAIRAALGKPSKAERFQAVYEVLNCWGDVVPLIFETGASLTVTDVEKNIDEENWWYSQPKISKLGKISTIGGNTEGIPEDSVQNWMSQELQASDWRIIRVLRVISTIDLLNHELQQQLASLYASVLSFDPPMLDRRTDAYPTWDDTPHALKIMSKVVVRSGARVNGLSIVYTDGSVSNSYGSKCTEHVFELSPGEYISDVIVWENEADVSTVQFITTTGRFSPLYGGYRGVPRILNSAGGVLAGFSGRMTDPYKDRDTVGRVQAIWRHDIPHSSTPSENRQTTYIGGPGGQPFNDWPFNGSPHSAYIKGVNVWCRDEIGSIQVTYSQQCSGGTVELNAGPYCSKPRGEKRSFELDAEEHIIAVSGTQTDRVLRLCFFTNKGRTSPTFGKNDGEAFMHQPKTIDGKSMRLAFIMGKQGDILDGLLLVWVPL